MQHRKSDPLDKRFNYWQTALKFVAFLDHYSCFLISVQVRFCASVRSVNPQSHHITLHIFRPRVRYGRAWPLCFGVRLFARRTFTTPKIRTFTTPKFGHFPPSKKNICQEDNCHPQFFFFFFWRIFLGFFDLQLMEDIKDGKEEVLDEVVMEHIK